MAKHEEPVPIVALMLRLGVSEDLAKQLLEYEEFGSDVVDTTETEADLRLADLEPVITETEQVSDRSPVQLLRERGLNDEEVVAALVEAGTTQMLALQLVALEDGHKPSDTGPVTMSEQEIQERSFGLRMQSFGAAGLEDAPPEMAIEQEPRAPGTPAAARIFDLQGPITETEQDGENIGERMNDAQGESREATPEELANPAAPKSSDPLEVAAMMTRLNTTEEAAKLMLDFQEAGDDVIDVPEGEE